MPELDRRLSALFLATFPKLNQQNVREASRSSVAEWDSIAAVTLMTLIQEEFGEQFELDDAADWTSYTEIRDAVRERMHG